VATLTGLTGEERDRLGARVIDGPMFKYPTPPSMGSDSMRSSSTTRCP
jgi:hypothetical protein